MVEQTPLPPFKSAIRQYARFELRFCHKRKNTIEAKIGSLQIHNFPQNG